MNRLALATFITSLLTTVWAQSASGTAAAAGPVISVFLLDTDPQPLVGSIIGITGGATMLNIQCAPGTPDNQCGYPAPITMTAASTTVHAMFSFSGISAEYGCQLTSSTTGSCSLTYAGDATAVLGQGNPFETGSASINPSSLTGRTTVSTIGPISQTDITYFPVTITAGSVAGLASGSAGAASSTWTGWAGNNTNSKPTGGAGSDGAVISNAVNSIVAGAGGGATASTPSSASTAMATFTGGAAETVVAPGVILAAFLGLAMWL